MNVKRILRAKHDRAGHAVAGHADAADEHAVLVKRNAARRAIQRRAENRDDGEAGRAAEADDAARLAEFVDVGKKQIREADADERSGRSVAHAGREMLLNDESGGARGERVLVAAEIGGRPGF